MRPGRPRSDSEHPHRPDDILEASFTHVVEGEVELVANFVAHHPADADAAPLGQTLQAGEAPAMLGDLGVAQFAEPNDGSPPPLGHSPPFD